MAGYYGNQMSNNAIAAYENGRKPISKINKSDIELFNINMSLAFFRWVVENKCNPAEWHHSSMFYIRTYFYDNESPRSKTAGYLTDGF